MQSQKLLEPALSNEFPSEPLPFLLSEAPLLRTADRFLSENRLCAYGRQQATLQLVLRESSTLLSQAVVC